MPRYLILAPVLGCLFGTAACSGSPSEESTEEASAVRARTTAQAQADPWSENQLERATELYRRGELDSTRVVLRELLTEARAVFDSATEARGLTLLGQTAYREGDYKTARIISEQALDLKLAIGLQQEYSRSYNALGLIAWSQSRLSDALDLYAKTAESAPPDSLRYRAVVAINRGLVDSDLGEFRKARLQFETGRDLSRQIANSRLEGIALNNLGMLEIWTGNPAGAFEPLRQAQASYRVAKVVDLEVNVLGQRGSAYTAVGELGRAIAVLDSAVGLARTRGLHHEEASNLEVLAEAYRTAGEYRRALGLYEEAEGINAELGLLQETGSDQRRRADIYASLGELTLARDYAERALATHRTGDARWEQLADVLLLADVAHEMGDSQSSESYLAEARLLAAAFDARSARVFTTLAEARIAERAGTPRRALAMLEQAWDELTTGGYESEWEAQSLKAQAYHSIGQLDSASAAGKAAVDAVERVRISLRSGALRSAYSAERSRVYSSLVSILLELGDLTGAFEIAASAGGQPLVGRLAPSSLRSTRNTGRVGQLEEAEAALRRIGELTARLREFDELAPVDRDSAALNEIAQLLAGARSEYEEVRIRAIESEPAATALLGSRRLGASEVMSALRPDEALVHYFVTEESGVGFVVRAGDVSSFEIPISDESLSRRVRVARELVGNPQVDGEAARDALRGLHELLVEPALLGGDLAGVERLIVVPHGVLTYLPFGALISAAGRFLVEDFAVQVLPSVAVLPVLRSRSSPAASSLSSAAAFAPLPSTLPATRAEIQAVQGAFSKGWTVEGRRASERRFRQALTEAEVVHVATHGALNVFNPLFSFLEFAPGPGEGGENDGRLEIHEVLGLSISSSLVFLSGCETGLGASWSTEFERGEDYATLALAFLYAGARNVVATLWPVEDEGAAAFATRFYAELQDSDPVFALAKAQRKLISHPNYAEPYYWAAYQLAGAGLTTPRTAARAVR